MSVESLFSLALALSFLAGLNLYLATFLAGLAVQFDWGRGGLHPALEWIGHPAVMITAGVLFLVEFIIDKIPWVDSVWDAVHTVIRPAGAVFLSLALLSAAHPGIGAAAALLGAVVALSTHLAKSGLRLALNASPEPFTNIIASLVEDGLVLGLFFLAVYHPFTAMSVSLALLAGIWLTLPKLLRLVKAHLYLMWKKLRCLLPWGRNRGGVTPPSALSARQQLRLRAHFPEGAPRAAWAVPCISGSSQGFAGMRGNIFGILLSPADQPGVLLFLPSRFLRRAPVRITLPGCGVQHEQSWLSENLVIVSAADNQQAVFRLHRGQKHLAAQLAADLRERLGLLPPAVRDAGGASDSLSPPSPRGSLSGGEPVSSLTNPPPLAN